MNVHIRRIAVAVSLAMAVVLALSSSASAEKPEPSTQSTFDRLVKAIQTKDRAKFLEGATDQMKKTITPELMEQLNTALASRFESGVEATYLAELKQQGCAVKLWKVSFKDGSDDVVLRVVMKGDKLAGFFMQ